MSNQQIFNAIATILLIAHFTLSVRMQFQIVKTTLLTTHQKWIQSVLLWLIPFFWYYLVRSIVIREGLQVKTSRTRKRKKGAFDDSWHSLTGFGGD